MAYFADLRCSYCITRLNINWFYEAMREYNMYFDFKPTNSRCISIHDIEEHGIQITINIFEGHINSAFNDWTVYKVFSHQKGTYKYENYENVWEFLREVAEDYSRNHPEVEITYKSDDDE